MTLFRILVGINAATLLVALYFFIDGLRYAGVSSDPAWLLLIGIPAAAIALGFALRGSGLPLAGNIVMAVPALPAVMYALLIATFVLSGEKWQ